MNIKEHLKNLVDLLLNDDDIVIDSISITRPMTEDPTASAQDDSVKQVPTGEIYISIRAVQK